MKRLASLAPLVGGLLLSCVYVTAGISHENPIGGLEGTVTMSENGKPLPHAIVRLSPTNWDSTLPEREAETDANGRFHIRAIAVGTYQLDARTFAHSDQIEKLSIEEGKPRHMELQLDPVADFVQLRASQHVFMPGESTHVNLSGFVPANSIDINITRMNPDRVAEAGGLQATFEPLEDSSRQLGPDHFGGPPVTTLHRPLVKDVEGAFIQRVPVPALPEGIYWIEADAGTLHSGSYLNITHMALVTKYAPSHILTYATDIKSGKPIAGATIYANGDKGLRQIGTSDADGLAEADFNTKRKSVVMARLGNSLAVCEREWERESGHEGPNTVFIYTDRSVYRPGDTVEFKGLVRRQNGPYYTLPNAEPIKISLHDERNNVLSELELKVSPRGAFHGAFTTSKEASPGDFSIVADSRSGSGSADVPIESYRKPDYTITVLSGKPYYMLGDRAQATISCQYYYGGPVVGAKVKISIFRSPDYLSDESESAQSDDMSDEGDGADQFQGGEYDQELEGVTDATGKLTITFPTRGDSDPDSFDTDYLYTVNASVADAGDRYFEGTGDVKVARGDVRLAVETDHYVASPGDVVTLTATTVDSPDSSTPAAGRPVELQVGVDDWYGRVRTFTLLQTLHLTTGKDGTVTAPITVQDRGSLRVMGTTVDRGGRTIRAETSIYVSGNYSRPEESEDQATFEVTLDRDHYDIGDKAKLLIRTSAPGGYALVTIQSDTILAKQVLPLDKHATMATLAVDVRMTPDAYVSVAYVKDEKFMQAGTELTVDRLDRNLQIEVHPDRPTAKPGETVTFDVETKDHNGKPVAADASLSVVDEAIYAIRREHIDIEGAFYPHRANNIDTAYSFPTIYLDGGDKGSGKMPIRSRFLDTAAWVPDVETGSDGHARVKVRLPDNLTRWRATAVACTSDGQVGLSKNDVTARKDLMVVVHSPTYLVAGDSQSVAVTVENDTGSDADVSLRLATSGLSVTSSPPGKLHVGSGKQESVDVDVTAKSSGNATLTAEAALPNGTGDAVRMAIPVEPHTQADIQTRSGDTDGSAILDFDRSATIDPAASRLRLTLSPSLATSLLRPMGALVDYPYGCVEQTMSRFVPSVLVTGAFKANGLPAPLRAADLPRIADDTFTRLNRLQHADGGWGWWEFDSSNAFMTSLVLDGLFQAKEAGYPAPKWLDTGRAVKWLTQWLAQNGLVENESEAPCAAYVLARYGDREDAAKILAAPYPLTDMPTTEAYFALTAKVLGKSPEPYLGRLRRMAIHDRRGAHFTDYPAWQWGDEATGIVLAAFVRLAPDDPLIPQVIRYLFASQQGEYWYSTRDSAAVVSAIAEYLKQTHEALAPTTLDVVLNGKRIRTVTLDPRTMITDATVDIPAAQWPAGNLNVELQCHGGHLYYQAELDQAVRKDRFDAEAPDPGFTVSRTLYLMEPTKQSDGTMRLLPSSRPVTSAPTGSILQCVVRVHSAKQRSFIQFECPTPSNCHIAEREDPLEGEEWGNWWAQTVIRDDRIEFFADDLKGDQELTFMVRAETPGTSSALPATAMNMYDPTDRSSSAETPFEVTR